MLVWWNVDNEDLIASTSAPDAKYNFSSTSKYDVTRMLYDKINRIININIIKYQLRR
jgi:hypothetical protein